MKKIIVFVLTSWLLQPAIAQDKKVSFGIKTGLNISTFSASVNSEASSRAGFHIGGYITTALSEKVSFRPELYLILRRVSASGLCGHQVR